MKNELTIQLIETDIYWEEPVKNRVQFLNYFSSLQKHADILVLPEMFTTGFTTNKTMAETMNGETIAWMKEQSSLLNSAIAGSLFIEENSHYFNRAIFMKPNGEFEYYDKHNLFVLADEYHEMTPGTTLPIIEFEGWKIALFICYDLRFPLWSWNILDNNNHKYDLAIYMGNWPSVRQHHWDSLLIARAIENRCYVAGINRLGIDANNKEYTGGSILLDYTGKPIVSSVSMSNLKNYRNNIFPLA